MGLIDLIRHSSFFALLRVFNAIAIIFLAEYIISNLSIEQYGEFSSYVSMGLIISAVMRFGFDRELVRNFKIMDNISSYYNSVITVVILASFFISICSLALFSDYKLAVFLGCCLAVGVVSAEKIRMANGILGYSLIKGFDYSVLATILIVLLGGTLIEYEFIYLMCAFFYSVFLLCATKWRPSFSRVPIDPQQLWIFSNTIINVLLGNFMIIYLSFTQEDALAGQFRYLVTWTAIFSIAQQSVLAASMRNLSFMIADSKPIFPELKRIWIFTSFVAAIFFFTLYVVLNSVLISLFSENLVANVDAFLFMFFIMALNFAFGPMGYVLHLVKRSKYLLLVNVFMVLFTFVLMMIFEVDFNIMVVLFIYGASILLKNLFLLWGVYAAFSYRLS